MLSADEREELPAGPAEVSDFWNEVSGHALFNLAIPRSVHMLSVRLDSIARQFRQTKGMNYEGAIRSLQDTAVVMAELQPRQSDVQKTQAGLVESLLEFRQQTEKNLAHVTVRLAEITDKLDGWIGFVDRLPKRPPQ
jgi:hypothetical protein